MSGVACAIAGAAVVGAAVTMMNRPGSPNYTTAPPASYYTYDAEGNLEGSQVWDAEQNAYIYRPAALTGEAKAEKEKVSAMKSTLLSNLDKTPDDRIAAYEEYASAFSAALHKDVDEQYAKTYQGTEENMNARGLFGSRAYVDTIADLNKQKTDADVDIATKATLAKNDLATTDQNYWLNELSLLNNMENADSAEALQTQQTTMQGAQTGSAAVNATNTAQNMNSYQTWLAKQNSNQAMASNLSNTATGLAFLYGYNKNGSKGGYTLGT